MRPIKIFCTQVSFLLPTRNASRFPPKDDESISLQPIAFERKVEALIINIKFFKPTPNRFYGKQDLFSRSLCLDSGVGEGKCDGLASSLFPVG